VNIYVVYTCTNSIATHTVLVNRMLYNMNRLHMYFLVSKKKLNPIDFIFVTIEFSTVWPACSLVIVPKNGAYVFVLQNSTTDDFSK